MSTRQAEDVLRHTFKQLEKMLKEVHEPKNAPNPDGGNPDGKNAGRRRKNGSEKKRK